MGRNWLTMTLLVLIFITERCITVLNFCFRNMLGYAYNTLTIAFRGPTKSHPVQYEYHSRDVWLSTLEIGMGAASLLHRNLATLTVVVCEQKPRLVWFSRGRKSYPARCEHSLSLGLSIICSTYTQWCFPRGLPGFFQRPVRKNFPNFKFPSPSPNRKVVSLSVFIVNKMTQISCKILCHLYGFIDWNTSIACEWTQRASSISDFRIYKWVTHLK